MIKKLILEYVSGSSYKFTICIDDMQITNIIVVEEDYNILQLAQDLIDILKKKEDTISNINKIVKNKKYKL